MDFSSSNNLTLWLGDIDIFNATHSTKECNNNFNKSLYSNSNISTNLHNIKYDVYNIEWIITLLKIGRLSNNNHMEVINSLGEGATE